MLKKEPSGSAQPRGATKTVETRMGKIGEPLAAICALQAYPAPDYRFFDVQQ